MPRWEPKYTFDKTTYSKEMYRSSNQWNCCFCQMCGKIVSDTYIERNDIRANPRYGWGQMYLSLCVQCSRDYILLRNNDYVYDGFIDNIKNADVRCEDTVDISIGEKIITFTAAHLAEVQAILEAEEEIGDTGEYEE